MSFDWLRWYHGTVSDPKWRVVAADTKQPIAVVVAIWAAMLEHGSNATERGPNATERGTLFGWNDRVIGAALDLSPEVVAAVRDAMQGLVLDGDKIKSWEKRQVKREDNSAERARIWRERKRAEANATERTRTPDKTRLDKNDSPHSPPRGKSDDPEFERWWSIYPLKVGKGAARKAWPTARQKADLSALTAGVERYIRSKPADRDYCHPATWLNQERWLDEQPPLLRPVSRIPLGAAGG